MKLSISAPNAEVAGRQGPMCIACGNTRRFWIHSPEGDHLVEIQQLPDGDTRITSCGRCRSRNSIVVARID